VGVVAKSYMEGGKLVPDDVVVGVISEAIQALPQGTAGFILDGFPRSLPQAEILDELLGRIGANIDSVIVVDVKDEVLVKRISGRFTCGSCGEVFNDYFRLPKSEGVCDRCGATAFKRRSDDNPDTVRERLVVYHDQTKPLIDYYKAKGKLHTIDGELAIDDVKDRINKILGGA
jgi:adenylate kinase